MKKKKVFITISIWAKDEMHTCFKEKRTIDVARRAEAQQKVPYL